MSTTNVTGALNIACPYYNERVYLESVDGKHNG
jgi:hypothetical protein